MASPTFNGWVPNVAGRLSFSHIGQTKQPQRCQTLNEDDPTGRAILCVQHRVLSDVLVSPWYFRSVYGYDPRWIFVFSAVSALDGNDRIGRLTGRVHIFSHSRWAQTLRESETEPPSLHHAAETQETCSPSTIVQRIFDEVDDETESPDGRVRKLRDSILAVHSALDGVAIYTIDCGVGRNGVVTLTERTRRSDVEFAASVLESPRPLDEKAARYLCNQAFFFIKDITHVHQHHHPKSDTITAAYLSDPEFSWVRETQYSMHRRVVSLRWMPTPRNLYDGLGIMAYMSSFAKVADSLGKATGGAEGATIALQYNLVEIENSIKATLEGRRWYRVQLNLILTAIPALMLAMASFLSPIGAASGRATGDHLSATFFDLARRFLGALLAPNIYGALSLAAFMLFVPFAYGAIDPSRTVPIFAVKRILTVWPKRRQVTVWLIFAGVFIFSAGFLLYKVSTGNMTYFLAWNTVFIAILAGMAGLFGFPYLFTIPDLWTRLRGRDVVAARLRTSS